MVATLRPPNDAVAGRVVLHADDFGMNRAVTQGILQGFDEGLLTSTSLLANAPDAECALAAWRELLHRRQAGRLASAAARDRLDDPEAPFDLGIHLNLTQGRPLTGGYPAELLDDRGCFPGVGRLFARLLRGIPGGGLRGIPGGGLRGVPGGGLRGTDRLTTCLTTAIEAELTAQTEVLLDHGLHPTHLNGHQYIETFPALESIVARLVVKYRIATVRAAVEPRAWRNSLAGGFRPAQWALALIKRRYALSFRAALDRRGLAHAGAFFGASHAGRIDLRLLPRFLDAGRGHALIEIGLHPATPHTQPPGDPAWHDPLALGRPGELQVLCSPQLADELAARRLLLGRLAA